MGYAVKLINADTGIKDKQITIRISAQASRSYRTYTAGGGTFYVGNKNVSYTINASTTNPNYGTGSKTVWLSEL